VARIFLSYRREDAAGATGRLADKLSERFATEEVFQDVHAIQAGENFEEVILDAVRTATVVLVIIGPRWLDLRTPNGTRRIDDPQDFVRREIETAHRAGVVIVPVLVEGAKMVSVTDLPPSLKPFGLRQAFELSDTRWQFDCSRLLGQLQDAMGIEPADPPERPPIPAKGRVLIDTVVSYIPDVFSLVARPKRFLIARSNGRQTGLVRAFVFLMISLLLANWLLWLVVSDMLPQSHLSFVLNGLALGLLGALAMSVLLYGAWRLAGASAGYWRIGIIFFYQIAIVAVGLFLSVGTLLFAVVWRDTGLPERIRAIMAAPGAASERVYAAAAEMEKGLPSTEYTVGFLVMLALLLVVVTWLAASWGAYRYSLGLPRWRSAIAFFLFCIFVWLPIAAVGWVAEFLVG
jgi:hypothetical protein